MDPVYPDGYNFDCNECGKCCRPPWMVGVNQHVYGKLKDSAWLKQAEAARGKAILVPVGETVHEIIHKEDGSCELLTPTNRCEVHAALGFDSKPTMCQQFPFILVNTPDGTHVGLSHFCDAVQRNEGGSLDRYSSQVRSWLEVARYPTVTDTSLSLDDGLTMDWAAYKLFEGWLQEQISNSPLPTAALWIGLLGVCRLAIHFRQVGVAHVDSDAMQKAVGSLSQRFLWGDAFLQYTNFSMAVIAAEWESRFPMEMKAIRQSMVDGKEFFSAILGATVSTASIQRYDSQVDSLVWKTPPFQRYLSHVVWRKFLALHPLVVSMSTLFLGSMLLDYYFFLSAHAANREVPTMTDVWRAIDTVETRLLGHASLALDVRKACATGYLEQIKAVDAGATT